MDQEIEKKLPPGFKVKKQDEPTEEQTKGLPKGFKVVKSTPESRDIKKLEEAAGPFKAEEKTPEQLKGMTVAEKIQYIEDLAREREAVAGPEFGKGILSGLTLGLTENVPGLKPLELEGTTGFSGVAPAGKFYGSLAPISLIAKAMSVPATALAIKSPVFQRQISSLFTMFGTGATVKGIETAFKGQIPSAEEVLEDGFKWAALDAGLRGLGSSALFLDSLLGRAMTTGRTPLEMLGIINRGIEEAGISWSQQEKVAQKAMEILEQPYTEEELAALSRKLEMPKAQRTEAQEVAESILGKPEAAAERQITPQDLKTRQVNDETWHRLNQDVRIQSEPLESKAGDFVKEAESIERDTIQELIEESGERAASEEALGNEIRDTIETRLEEAKASYRPLYQEVEEASKGIISQPVSTGRYAGEKLKEIVKYKTKPEGYERVIRTLENVLEDTGYAIQKNKEGVIEEIIKTKDTAVDDMIEVGRRLNEMIAFDTFEPSVENVLKKVVKEVKADIRRSLAGHPELLEQWNTAEATHGDVASRFGRKSVKSIRGQQAGERVTKALESPTAMADVKQILSPEDLKQFEREMLEKLNSQSYDNAQKMYRKMKGHLSEQNKMLAREIVEAKNPHNPAMREKLVKQSVVDDMSKTLTTGERPEKTMKLWQTPKGQRLVKDAFYGSPNWPQVKNYLERQSFADMVKSVTTKEGVIDFKQFNEFMKDPAMVKNIREQGGEEAVTFFKNMKDMVKKAEWKVKRLDRLPTKEDVELYKKFRKESLGQRKIERAVEKQQKPKRVVEKFREEKIYSKKKGTPKPTDQEMKTIEERGRKILDRMADADFPIQAHAKTLANWMKESLGFPAKAAISAIGLMKLGLSKSVVGMIGYRMLNKFMTSPAMRDVFRHVINTDINTIQLMIALEALGNAAE